MEEGRRHFVVAVGGSFNPVHCGHVAMLCCAREVLEELWPGCVVEGLLAVAEQGHVRGKMPRHEVIRAQHRIAMANAATAALPWVVPTTRCFGSSALGVAAMWKGRDDDALWSVDVVGGDHGYRQRKFSGRTMRMVIAREGDSEHVERRLQEGQRFHVDAAHNIIYVRGTEQTAVSSTKVRPYLLQHDTEAAVRAGMLDAAVAAYVDQHRHDLFEEVLPP